MKTTPTEKREATVAEDRETYLREQIRDLWMLLAMPCNVPNPERRAELEHRVLMLTAELHGLQPPPVNPLGDPDDD
ncbi:hypothetical protein J4558_23650 [Leptolyngbya sp. 15MV]|nr:hypothetical protein J4558_23650 [Leptolyngbya sp. 15MV]